MSLSDGQWMSRQLLTLAAMLTVLSGVVASAEGTAHADQGDDVDPNVRGYLVFAGPAVCHTLDIYPTEVGVAGVMQAIIESGFSDYQAGQVVVLSVIDKCPRHTALLHRIVTSQPADSL